MFNVTAVDDVVMTTGKFFRHRLGVFNRVLQPLFDASEVLRVMIHIFRLNQARRVKLNDKLKSKVDKNVRIVGVGLGLFCILSLLFSQLLVQ